MKAETRLGKGGWGRGNDNHTLNRRQRAFRATDTLECVCKKSAECLSDGNFSVVSCVDDDVVDNDDDDDDDDKAALVGILVVVSLAALGLAVSRFYHSSKSCDIARGCFHDATRSAFKRYGRILLPVV